MGKGGMKRSNQPNFIWLPLSHCDERNRRLPIIFSRAQTSKQADMPPTCNSQRGESDTESAARVRTAAGSEDRPTRNRQLCEEASDVAVKRKEER